MGPKALLASGAFLIVVFAGSAFAPPSRDAQESLAFEPGDTLSLETYKGTLRLIPTDDDRVEIHARIAAPDTVTNARYARQIVEKSRVVVERTQNGVHVKSEHDAIPSFQLPENPEVTVRTLPEVHYEIRAPRHIDLVLSDHKSDFEAEGFRGTFRLRSHMGTLNLRDLEGRLDLDTHQGVVTLEEFRGSLRVKTHKGAVTVDASVIDGNSSLETYKGNLRLAIPSSQAATIHTHINERGTLASDFPIEYGEDVVDALGHGGPTIDLKTNLGTIFLTRRVH